jgi:hypothetical protein
MQVPLRNNFTGQVKLIKIGWSWTLFFFGPFFGIPLFIRRLPELGIVAGFFSSAKFATDLMPTNGGFKLVLDALLLVVTFWLAINGNRLTGMRYLERGWSFAEPDSQLAQLARLDWRLGPAAGSSNVQAGSPQEQSALLAANLASAQRDTMLTVLGIFIIAAMFILPILYYAAIAYYAPD